MLINDTSFGIIIFIFVLTLIYIIKKLQNLNTEIKNVNSENYQMKNEFHNLKNNFNFQQNFFIKYEEKRNLTFKTKEEVNELKTNYLIKVFSGKLKTFMAFARFVTFRKITNCVLNNLIYKNENYLKKTQKIFIDIFKPKDNQKPFFIIYCAAKTINEINAAMVNICIDFLMFIHNYTSEKIHLNKLENKDIIDNIKKISDDKSGSSDEINTKTTEAASFNTYEVIDYMFKPVDLKSEEENIIRKLYPEKKQIYEINDNKEINETKKEKEDEKYNTQKNENVNKKGKPVETNEKEENKAKEKNKEKEENKEKDNNKEKEEIKEKKRKKKKKKKEKEEMLEKTNKNNKEGNNIKEVEENEKNNDKENVPKKEEEEKKYEKDQIQKFEIDNQERNNDIEKKGLEDKEIIKENELGVEKEEKEEAFKNFLSKINDDGYLKNKHLDFIKTLYFQDNKQEINLRKLMELYDTEIKKIQGLEVEKNNYEKKNNTYIYDYPEEFSIERIFELYKMQFDSNSDIYNEVLAQNHFRFNKKYLKIIDKTIINNSNLSDLAENIKKLSGNDLIDLLSVDTGNFGSSLSEEKI